MATRYGFSRGSGEHPGYVWDAGWAATGSSGHVLRVLNIDTGLTVMSRFASGPDQNRGYGQWSSRLLTPGQSIFGTWKCQTRWYTQIDTAYAVVAARIVGSDGTVRQTFTAAVRHGTAMVSGNFGFSGYQGTPYVTVAGDRVVVELGWGGVTGTRQKDFYHGYTSLGWQAETTFAAGGANLSSWFELSDVTLTHLDPVVTAGAGAFGLSGQTAELLRAPNPLVADAGAFVLAGQAAAFIVGKNVAANAGAFTVSGQAADVLATRTAEFAAGAFTLSGQAVELNHGYAAEMNVGAFVLAGQDAGYVIAKGIEGGTGAFGVSGQAATLAYSGDLPPAVMPNFGDTLLWLMVDEPGGSW